MAPSSTARNASVSGSANANETSATTGMTRSATWALDEMAISVASFILPRLAITTAPPCSAAFPTTATITNEMKNSERCAACANASSEWTRISLIAAVATVAAASARSETFRLQPPAAPSCPSDVPRTPRNVITM